LQAGEQDGGQIGHTERAVGARQQRVCRRPASRRAETARCPFPLARRCSLKSVGTQTSHCAATHNSSLIIFQHNSSDSISQPAPQVTAGPGACFRKAPATALIATRALDRLSSPNGLESHSAPLGLLSVGRAGAIAECRRRPIWGVTNWPAATSDWQQAAARSPL
jgi:hypothetical protein